MKKTHSKLLNSYGFSLVELIVVIAIMAVMVGGAILSVNILASGDAKKASKTVDSMLSETRTSTLSKQGDWNLRISNIDGSMTVEIMNGANVQSTKRLGSRIQLSYEDGSGKAIVLTKGDAFTIKYALASGRFERIENGTGSLMQEGSAYGQLIMKGSNSDTEYVLKLWYETGRITSEG